MCVCKHFSNIKMLKTCNVLKNSNKSIRSILASSHVSLPEVIPLNWCSALWMLYCSCKSSASHCTVFHHLRVVADFITKFCYYLVNDWKQLIVLELQTINSLLEELSPKHVLHLWYFNSFIKCITVIFILST